MKKTIRVNSHVRRIKTGVVRVRTHYRVIGRISRRRR